MEPTKKQLELMAMDSKQDVFEHVPDTIPRLLSERSTRDVLSDAVNKISYLYEKIASGISDEDIELMSTRDKVQSLQKLAHLHEIVNKSAKNAKNTFNFINVKKAGREELEAAMMDVNQE